MIPLLWLLAAGGGAGALKHFVSDKPAADAQNKLLAESWRNSPWTGMQPTGSVEHPSLMGNILSGAMMGMGQGAKIEGMQGDAALKKAQLNYLNADTERVKNGLGPVRPPNLNFNLGSTPDYGVMGGGTAPGGAYDLNSWFRL